MKIISLTAENIKKLVAVQITPQGNIVEITGKNGQGKTSILDSIWWAIAGAEHIQAQPIRKGQMTAKIRLDLGELIVERRFTEKGSYLSVENAQGAMFKSPQKMLDDLIGALSFDPLGFARMKPKDQFDALRHISKIGIDLEQSDALDRGDFAKRTDVNRDAKAKRAAADLIAIPADLPADRVDTAALLQELQEVGTFNGEIEQRKARRESVAETIASRKLRVEEMETEIAAMLRRVDEKRQAQDELRQAWMSDQRKLDEAEPLPAPKDAQEVRKRLTAAELTNGLIGHRENKAKITAEAEALEKRAQELTDAIAARATAKAEAIAKAEMPIAGIGFGDGLVTYNGVPFDQASSAEQLRVSMSIAMAGNPKLRVIRIQDGSLLDDDSMAEIAKMADASDYQVWIERVDASGKIGFVVEDGHVRIAGEEKTDA